ncbi:hypothetical protein GmHk_15G044139 [Glycine max]|nr:hypothetical protein GmHk_15G044139 [Glycine max]
MNLLVVRVRQAQRQQGQGHQGQQRNEEQFEPIIRNLLEQADGEAVTGGGVHNWGEITLARVYGDGDESNNLLNRWLGWMVQKCLGSTYEIETTEFWYGGALHTQFRKFKHVFWTFKTFVNMFNLCKLIMQIDGTFLYGKYEVTLLIATSQNGNECALPIAFAFVEKETQSIKSVVVMSQQWQPPNAYHVYCIRHIASNFNHKFRNSKLNEELIKLGYTTCFAPIGGISKEKWSLTHDQGGRRYGYMTTNLSETINKIFKGAQNMPVIALVKVTHDILVQYFVRRGLQA